jgi:hypothetical protein
VGHVHELDLERPELEHLARLEPLELDVLELCSSSRERAIAIGSGRPNTGGASSGPSSRRIHGSAPRWSSWPW